MIQFNLLPDVKIEYIKARRRRRSVLVVAAMVSGTALAIVSLLGSAVFLQAQHSNNLDDDISKYTADIKNIPNLDKILTVQQQLNTLSSLHDAKPVTSRVRTYLGQVTPANIAYSSIQLDFINNTATFTGSADSIRTINQFVDTLKFTRYTSEANPTPLPPFTDVVLTSFSKSEGEISYKIDLKFDPEIFKFTSSIKLEVPTSTTTRSVQEAPKDIQLKAPTNELDATLNGEGAQ